MKKIIFSDKKGNDLYQITFFNKDTYKKMIKNLSKLKKFVNFKEVE